MQRVVYISATDELGGSDQSMFELVRSLDRERFEPHVVLPHRGAFVDRYRALGVPVHVVPLKKLKNTRDPRWHLSWLLQAPLRVLRLRRLFSSLRPAVIHVNSSVEVLAGVAAAGHRRRHGGRLVWHVREAELRPRLVERAIFALVRRLADTVIAISPPVAERIGARERVYVIPNGIDVERFGARRTAPTAIERPLTVGWVGRIAPGKGLAGVLDAFARVRAAVPAARLVLMGAVAEGHEELAARLLERAKQWGDAVTILPAGPATERAYAQMDVFVHLPEIAEGLGRTVIEAQAAGVPVVTWPRGGLTATVRDGVTGCFAPVGDVDAAADLAIGLLSDPPRRRAMGSAARRFAAATFSRERCAEATSRTYVEVLS